MRENYWCYHDPAFATSGRTGTGKHQRGYAASNLHEFKLSLHKQCERTTVTVSTVVETHITVCIHGVNIGIPCKDCELKSDTEFGHLYKSREGENQLKGLLELSNDDIVKSAKINPEGVVEVLMDEINDLQSALRDLRQKQPTIPQGNAEELIRDIRHADSQGADDILMPRALELCAHYEALRQKTEGRLSLEEIESIRPFFALKTLDSDSSISDKALKNIGIAQAILREIRTKFASLTTNEAESTEFKK